MFNILNVVYLNLCIGNQVRNLGYGNKTCLDSPARKTDLNKPAGLYPCHKMGGNQVGLLPFFYGTEAYFAYRIVEVEPVQ